MWRNGGVHRRHNDVVGTSSRVERRLNDAVRERLRVVIVDDVQRLSGTHACHTPAITTQLQLPATHFTRVSIHEQKYTALNASTGKKTAANDYWPA